MPTAPGADGKFWLGASKWLGAALAALGESAWDPGASNATALPRQGGAARDPHVAGSPLTSMASTPHFRAFIFVPPRPSYLLLSPHWVFKKIK